MEKNDEGGRGEEMGANERGRKVLRWKWEGGDNGWVTKMERQSVGLM